MVADVVKRPYITVGFTALVLLVPLAATSTTGMVRRLGAVAWRRLHRLVYLIAILGVLHFLWLAKVGVQDPYYYAAWLAVLFVVRVVDAVRRARIRARRSASGARSPRAPRGPPERLARRGAAPLAGAALCYRDRRRAVAVNAQEGGRW